MLTNIKRNDTTKKDTKGTKEKESSTNCTNAQERNDGERNNEKTSGDVILPTTRPAERIGVNLRINKLLHFDEK